MTLGLMITAVLMGAVGVPHCLIMCGAPCSVVAQACSGGAHQRTDALLGLHMGRITGYAGLGALAAALASFSHLLMQHVTALRPLWMMLQLAVLVLGLLMLVTGRMPDWLQSVRFPFQRLSQRITQHPTLSTWPVAWRSALLGSCWALLPCAQLYAAVVLAAMADNAGAGAAVMVAFALPGALGLMLSHRWISFLRATASFSAVRLTGAVLTASSVLMLSHSFDRVVRAFC